MSQIHKRFSDEQIRVLFQGCCQGQFSRSNLQELLAVEEGAPHVGVDWPLLVVDGFDHFTEVQQGLLKVLADRVGEMIIILTGSMEGSKRRPVRRLFQYLDNQYDVRYNCRWLQNAAQYA